MKKKDSAITILGFTLAMAAVVVGLYYDGKLIIAMLLHPLRVVERLVLPFLAILLIFWLVGRAQLIYSRLRRSRSTS